MANQQRAVFRLKSGGWMRPERFSKTTRSRSRTVGRMLVMFKRSPEP